MADRENIVQALKDSLRNQHCGFIEGVGNVYAVSEETINDTLELLKEQESIIESLESDFHETLEVVSGRLNVVRCKDCKHRPKEPNLETFENGFDIEFPEGSKCPCQCSGDEYYSWCPEDDWFCANGERRET